MQAYGITDKGNFRKNNQDYFSIKRCEKKSCYIVALCDGMGGEASGEIASELANKSFVDYVNSKLTSRTCLNPCVHDVLIDACNDANAMAYEYSMFDPSLNGMGTTIVGGVISDIGIVRIVNIGDSRAYTFSYIEEKISQLTTDHSLVEDLVKNGVLTKDQAKNHPQKNIITRAIGTDESVETDYFETVLLDGDILLLCSDGLSNSVSNDEMLEIFMNYKSLSEFCNNLLNRALNNGATDNITLIAVLNK